MRTPKLILLMILCLSVLGCGQSLRSGGSAPKISTAPIQAAATQAAIKVEASAKTVEARAANIQSEATSASTEPTTQAVQPHLTAIEADANALVGVSVDLAATGAALRQLQSDIAATQKQIDQLRADYTTAQKAVADAQEAQRIAEGDMKKWKGKYESQWLAGKSWATIYWIAGIVTTLIIIDTLLWFFTQSASLNPLTLIVFAVKKVIALIGGIFAKKVIPAPVMPKP